MDDKVRYKFKIDAFTPATLPMKRLAEYMLEVAQLLGEHEHVHFIDVEPGSALLVHDVDFVAVPKVRDRLRASALVAAPDDLVRRRDTLNKMLAADNAVGVLQEVGNKTLILQFKGRELVSEEIAGVTEEGTIQGRLVRIGGTDKTAHATIEGEEGSYRCDMTRALARELAPHLYGALVRIEGRGSWHRTSEGTWELQAFRANSFRILEDEGFREGIARLRKANADGRMVERGVSADELLRIREGR